MDIPESYASPGQRLGLFRADHPNAPQPKYTLVKGTEAGIPKKFGGDQEFCICTLAYGPEEGIEPVIGWKELPSKYVPAEWHNLCIKTLGRTLKAAGYPADLHELNDVQGWRMKNAKVAAVVAGFTTEAPQSTPAPEPVRESAPVDIDPEDHTDPDEAHEPAAAPADVPVTDEHPTPKPEKVEQPKLEAVPDATDGQGDAPDREAIRAELNSLNEEEKIAFRSFMVEAGITGKGDTWTNEQYCDIERWLTS